MSRTTKLLFLLFAMMAACLGQSEIDKNCLSYEPSVVKLSGTLVRKTFPGPPEYKSIRDGDRPETSWFLNLKMPVCVDRDKAQPDLNPAQNDVRTVQLVVSAESYKKYESLVGQWIMVTGMLFGEHTGHHHAQVLLTIISLAKAERR